MREDSPEIIEGRQRAASGVNRESVMAEAGEEVVPKTKILVVEDNLYSSYALTSILDQY